ncbi:MAG: hypothetical protein GY768_24735, partial [Planctomycetaceae bacterium]|nr:hypothetical protein [Planctomycetaceae bacterium]
MDQDDVPEGTNPANTDTKHSRAPCAVSATTQPEGMILSAMSAEEILDLNSSDADETLDEALLECLPEDECSFRLKYQPNGTYCKYKARRCVQESYSDEWKEFGWYDEYDCHDEFNWATFPEGNDPSLVGIQD